MRRRSSTALLLASILALVATSAPEAEPEFLGTGSADLPVVDLDPEAPEVAFRITATTTLPRSMPEGAGYYGQLTARAALVEGPLACVVLYLETCDRGWPLEGAGMPDETFSLSTYGLFTDCAPGATCEAEVCLRAVSDCTETVSLDLDADVTLAYGGQDPDDGDPVEFDIAVEYEEIPVEPPCGGDDTGDTGGA